MTTIPNNSRNAGRKKLGRIETKLALNPPVRAALTEWATAHSTNMTNAANILLSEALKLNPAEAGKTGELK